MADPALSYPPFIPEGTFRCCLCFDVFPVEASSGGYDVCVPCDERDRVEAWCHWMVRILNNDPS